MSTLHDHLENDSSHDVDHNEDILRSFMENPTTTEVFNQTVASIPPGHPSSFLSTSCVVPHNPVLTNDSEENKIQKKVPKSKIPSILKKISKVAIKPARSSRGAFALTFSPNMGDSAGGDASHRQRLAQLGGLMDSGTQTGMAGHVMRLLRWDDDGIGSNQVSVHGAIGNAEGGFRLGTFGTASRDTEGETIILIFSQYLCRGNLDQDNDDDVTLHSPIQLRNSGVDLDDRLVIHGGRQRVTIEGHSFTLTCTDGYLVFPSWRFSDREWEQSRKVIVTRGPWNPSVCNDNRTIEPNEQQILPYGSVRFRNPGFIGRGRESFIDRGPHTSYGGVNISLGHANDFIGHAERDGQALWDIIPERDAWRLQQSMRSPPRRRSVYDEASDDDSLPPLGYDDDDVGDHIPPMYPPSPVPMSPPDIAGGGVAAQLQGPDDGETDDDSISFPSLISLPSLIPVGFIHDTIFNRANVREEHPVRRHEPVVTDTYVGEELQVAMDQELHRLHINNLNMELRGVAETARDGYISKDILDQLRTYMRPNIENIRVHYTREYDSRIKARFVTG